MKTAALVTGGAGFIGHHVVEHLLKNTDWNVVCLDRLDCSGNLNRLADMTIWESQRHRVRVVFHDLRAAVNSQVAAQIGDVDHVLHLAASTHVDRSITDPMLFVMDNVVGTTNLLNFVRERKDAIKSTLYFSTDEVFGPAPQGVRYKEWDRYKSGNPYAASKAGAEEMAIAFQNTYGLPLFVTHTMNVFGERQHPEKFLPSTIRKVLAGKTVTIHADKAKTTSGTRFYIHARNVASALLFLLGEGRATWGEKYNVVGEREVSNLGLAQAIAGVLGKELKYEMVDFHSSRPGHDLRYALDGEKMQSMGWKVPMDFERSLEATVRWTVANDRWLVG